VIANSPHDLQGLRASGRAVRAAFEAMFSACEAGMTTRALDNIGAAELLRQGARSAPKMYYDFPGATCISVNEEAAHGIPGDRLICDGDMVNIDVSANLEGYVADMGQSFVVGRASEAQARICRAVEEAVLQAIARVHSGCSLNVIGEAVQAVADRHGYTIVENLGSHGVGGSIHEEPSYIPMNNPLETRTLDRGCVLTIEPFFSSGARWVEEGEDGWTLSVPEGQLVAQFEHTIIVTDADALVITA